ncbi:acyl carrier protein phosphodiesterase [Pontibacter arcticus]|uniref:DUF479 domain-containing protein n=1 Tax=Pontibacter arcticus TaxID=2080288 RepID=A0A364RG58_9BACT|nr:ACP phosphodiesterase [Pontibacter arcticus]RAU83245.1 DUF479 domain-containing protein [Pontibacter arcticus]
MNYLAHTFLSGNDDELLIGNFIADGVRGKQAQAFSPGIINGIALHRAIDAFTDTHPVVAETKNRLRTKYKKYAPVIADMYYDHFLASRFELYADVPLEIYTSEVYKLITSYQAILPARVQHLFAHMKQHNWLLSYAQLSGIGQALTGMSQRTTFNSGMETAVYELQENYALYEQEFALFFPELVTYSEAFRKTLL